MQVIVGGQFGSEAKGAVTAAVCAEAASMGRPVTVVRVGGPNAGHSAADPTGQVWALRQVPAGMVVDHRVWGVIASGSEIDPQVLDAEIASLEAAGIDVSGRLIVSDAATIVTPDHRDRETALVGAIGSTGKGIGAARADRVMRRADTVATSGYTGKIGFLVDTAEALERRLNEQARNPSQTVVLEGTQGYGLGLHTKFYPQVTSGDCRAIDVCAQAGVNPWGAADGVQVHVVVRPYPIRVAGNSGPLEGETSWEQLGLPVELTTVTRKPRRVGTYDRALVDAAVTANGPNPYLAISMVDQVPDAVDSNKQLTEIGERFLTDTAIYHNAPVRWYGVGQTIRDWRRWS